MPAIHCDLCSVKLHHTINMSFCVLVEKSDLKKLLCYCGRICHSQRRAGRDIFDSMHLLVQSSCDSHPGLHWHFWSVQIPSILQSIFVLHMNSKNIQIFKLCKAISNETDFFVYQSNLQSYPNWLCIGRFQIHHITHLVYDSPHQMNKNRLKRERPLFIVFPHISSLFDKYYLCSYTQSNTVLKD